MAMDLSHLSEQEREAIMDVLLRDEELRKKETERVTKMKNELVGIRQKGALKSGLDPEYSCARCRTGLGRVLNRGDPCTGCQGKVCKECRVYSPNNSQVWLCVVCFKQMEIQAASGLWMNEFIRRPSRRRDHKVTTGDIVKSNIIRRSWTSADGLQQNPDRISVAVRDPPSSSSTSVHLRHPHSSSPRGGPNQTRLPPLPPSSSSARRSAPPVNERPPFLRSPQSMAEPRMDSSANTGESRPPKSSPGGFPAPPVTQRKTPSPTSRTDSRLSSTPSPQHPSLSPQHPDAELFAVRSSSGGDVSRSSPSPQHQAQQSPSPRSNRPIPSPIPRPESSGSVSPSPTPSPRQRSPLQKQRAVEPERNMSNESQDSGYLTHSQVTSSTVHRESHRMSEIFDSGYDNQGSPRTSRSSEHSRQSSGVSSSRTDSREPTGDSVSGSDLSDNEDVDPTNEVVFRKIKPTPKKRGSNQHDWHLNDARTHPATSAVPPPWGHIGGAHSLPRTKARTVHSISMPFYQYSPSSADDNSGATRGTWSSNSFPQSLHVMGGSLTLPRRGSRSSEVWVTGSTTEFVSHDDLISAQDRSSVSNSFVLRPLDGHRRTPTGSPVVKRIRRNRRESSTKGGRLRSPERFPGKENLPFDLRASPEERMEEGNEEDLRREKTDSPTGSEGCRRLGRPVLSSSFEEIPLASLEFDEEIPIARSYSNDMYGDILLNVTNKIIPESDDYKLVFISSSSSKSSGLNSLDGSSGEVSESSSRRVSSVVDESEMMVFVDESDFEGGESRRNSILPEETGSKDNEVKENSASMCTESSGAAADQVKVVSDPAFLDICTYPNMCLPSTYQEIVDSLSPTHSVDEVETDDHVLKPISQSDVVSVKVSGAAVSPSNSSSVPGGSFYLGSCRETEEFEQVRLRRHDWHPVTIDTASQINVTPGQLLGASYLEPPPGANISNNNVRVTTQMHANRYFIRSDSARSSGERSMEEVSCYDHVLPFPSSPQPSELEDDYKNILSEIRSYTSQSCDDVASFLSNSNPKSLPEPPPVYLRLSDWNDSSLSSLNWLTLSGSECSFNNQQLPVQGYETRQHTNPAQWAFPTSSPNSSWPGYPLDLSTVTPLEVTSALSTGDFSEIDTASTACTEASSVRERLDLESEGKSASPTSELCSSIADASDEWEYRVGTGETSTMALQVNLSAETELELHTDANVETQSVHCTVDDDTLSISTFSEDGLGDGSPSIGKADVLVSLLGPPPTVVCDDVTHSDKVCNDKILPLNTDYTVPLMQTERVTDASSSNESGDSPIAANSSASLNALVNDVSVSEEEVDLERRPSQGSLSNADSTSEMGVMSLSSEGIEDEDEDFICFSAKEAAILESLSLPTDQSVSLGSNADQVSENRDCEHLNTLGEMVKDTKTTPDSSIENSEQLHVVKGEAPHPAAEAVVNDGSGNLVYYLGPQGTQSMYLVRTEKLGTTGSLEMNTGEQETKTSSDLEAEVVFSGDDRTGSDTDSQDTVIEGESYKRMRQLAVQNKIIEANEELNGHDTTVNVKAGISEISSAVKEDGKQETPMQTEAENKSDMPSHISGSTEEEEAILTELMDSPTLGDLPSPMSRGSIDSDFPSSPPPPLPLSSPPLAGSLSSNDSSLQRAAESCAEAILELVSSIDSAMNVDVISTVTSDVNGNDVHERTGSYNEEIGMQVDASPAVVDDHEHSSSTAKTMDGSDAILEAHKENIDTEIEQINLLAVNECDVTDSAVKLKLQETVTEKDDSVCPELHTLESSKQDNTQSADDTRAVTETGEELQNGFESNVELLSFKVFEANEELNKGVSEICQSTPDTEQKPEAEDSKPSGDKVTAVNGGHSEENEVAAAIATVGKPLSGTTINANIAQERCTEVLMTTRESFMESQLSGSVDNAPIFTQESCDILQKLLESRNSPIQDKLPVLLDKAAVLDVEVVVEESGIPKSEEALLTTEGSTDLVETSDTPHVRVELPIKTGEQIILEPEQTTQDKDIHEPDPYDGKTVEKANLDIDAAEIDSKDSADRKTGVENNVTSEDVNQQEVCSQDVIQDKNVCEVTTQNTETNDTVSHSDEIDTKIAEEVKLDTDVVAVTNKDSESSIAVNKSTEEHVIDEQDTSSTKEVKQDIEAHGIGKQESEDAEPSGANEENGATEDIKEDTQTTVAGKQDTEIGIAVEQDIEMNETAKQDPEKSNVTQQDTETREESKLDTKTTEGAKTDTETSENAKLDSDVCEAPELDSETSEAATESTISTGIKTIPPTDHEIATCQDTKQETSVDSKPVVSHELISEEETETKLPSAVDVTSLQELIANSRKLTNPQETSDVSEEGPSVLEKYYTCSLGASNTSNKARKTATAHNEKSQGPLANYYETLANKESEEELSSLEVDASSEVPSDRVSSDNWDSEPSEWVDDSDTTFSDSASSDEANFDREEELRGFCRTIDFSLHTIIEESCEESESEREKIRAQKTPQPPEDPSDLEKYFNFTIGDTLLELQKRRSLAEDSEASDTYSETSGSVCSESVPSVGEDVDPATLASSRLEKYFMTGFLGLEHYGSFEDPYATDESGSVGSGSEASSITTASSFNGSPHASRKGASNLIATVAKASTSRRKKASPGGDGNVSDGSSSTLSDSDEKPRASEEDSTDAPFEKNDGFDTIKRNKKKTTEKLQQHKTCLAASKEKIDEPNPACSEDPENCATPIAEPAEELLNSASSPKPEERSFGLPKIAEPLSDKTDVNSPTDELVKPLENANIPKLPDIQCDTVYTVETSLISGDKPCPSDITTTLLSLKEEPEVSATPLPDSIVVPGTAIDITLLDKVKQCGLDRKQQSRDSGFIGSSDDLLKDSADALDDSSSAAEEAAAECIKSIDATIPEIDLGVGTTEESKDEEQLLETASQASNKKKLSLETCSSDDETRYIVGQLMEQITKGFSMRMNGSPLLPRAKPPELEAFETELTKLMQTVPGIDATVKEIVEELSSTDYYSDSYESSDYTNSDVDGPTRLGFLRRSIRSSLRSNDDTRLHWSKDGATGLLVAQENALNVGEQGTSEGGVLLGDLDDGLREDANSPFTRETIYIYDRLMTSLGKMAEQASKESSDSEHPGNQSPSSTRSHPSATLQAVQHIRDRLASLMREVHTTPSDGFTSAGRVRRNNSSSSSSSWMGIAAPPRPHLETVATLRPAEVLEGNTTKPYTGSLHADITRWLAKQQFNSGDEQSISSTSSTTYESEDSPTDTELSLDSDDMNTPAAILQRKDSKKGLSSSLVKRDRTGSDITIVDDDLSFRSLDTPETLFATHKIGAVSNPLLIDARNKRFSESSLRRLKSLQERGVMDLQYFVTQASNNEYEVWQNMIVDKDKFTVGEDGSNVTGGRSEADSRQILRARHLLDSLRSSSSDTLQCISEEDLDSKPSSSRTSVLGSSTNIWSSSQSSLADGKRGSLEALGSMSETTQSPLPDRDLNVVLRKGGLIAIDIPLSEAETEADSGAACSTSPSDSQQYRSSFHTEVLDSGTITNTKDKMDFRSSLHLWLESSGLGGQKSAPRAMSADPLPQDCSWSTPNLLYATRKSKSREISLGAAPRPRSMGINLSDNHLDRPVSHHQHTKYSTIAKSGPISMSPPQPPSFQDPARPKASTLPRIGGDTLHANVSFLHKTPSCFMTNPPPPTAAPSSQSKWSRMPMDPQARREVQSWPAEEFAASIEPPPQPRAAKRSALKSAPPVPEGKGAPIPQISVSDITESHPSGRSSLCSHGNNSDRESMPEEDIDRLVAMHKTRSSLSSLGTRSDSMTSVYSAAGGGRYGTVVVRGEAFFSLSYNYKLGALEVHIKQCRDIASVDTKRSRSDPYVKVYLLPDKSKSGKRKTKVKKHTLNPVFDEVLRFNVTISELETRTLWLTVWHSDMFGRNDFLGEVMLPLGYEVFEDVSPKWYMLQERLGPPEEVMTYKGEVTVALKFVPPDVTTQKKGKQAKGSLHVLVKEARNLTAVRANGTSDPFCKSYLLPDKGKVSKQKTHVIKKNCSPKWNHTFVYDDVNIDELHDRCLELTVWDYDRLTSNDFLGGVRLSLGTGRYQGKEVDWLDSSGEEIVMWQAMLERPNMWVDGTLLLQPTMEKRL